MLKWQLLQPRRNSTATQQGIYRPRNRPPSDLRWEHSGTPPQTPPPVVPTNDVASSTCALNTRHCQCLLQWPKRWVRTALTAADRNMDDSSTLKTNHGGERTGRKQEDVIHYIIPHLTGTRSSLVQQPPCCRTTPKESVNLLEGSPARTDSRGGIIQHHSSGGHGHHHGPHHNAATPKPASLTLLPWVPLAMVRKIKIHHSSAFRTHPIPQQQALTSPPPPKQQKQPFVPWITLAQSNCKMVKATKLGH